jgi:hypothetical protein
MGGVDGTVLKRYLKQKVTLIKDDDFVIFGIVKEIHDGCIIFYSDGKELALSFDRIKEIRPNSTRWDDHNY